MPEIRSVSIMAEPLPHGEVPPKRVRVTAAVTLQGQKKVPKVDAELETPFELGYLPSLAIERVVAGIERAMGRELLPDEHETVSRGVVYRLEKLF